MTKHIPTNPSLPKLVRCIFHFSEDRCGEAACYAYVEDLSLEGLVPGKIPAFFPIACPHHAFPDPFNKMAYVGVRLRDTDLGEGSFDPPSPKDEALVPENVRA